MSGTGSTSMLASLGQAQAAQGRAATKGDDEHGKSSSLQAGFAQLLGKASQEELAKGAATFPTDARAEQPVAERWTTTIVQSSEPKLGDGRTAAPEEAVPEVATAKSNAATQARPLARATTKNPPPIASATKSATRSNSESPATEPKTVGSAAEMLQAEPTDSQPKQAEAISGGRVQNPATLGASAQQTATRSPVRSPGEQATLPRTTTEDWPAQSAPDASTARVTTPATKQDETPAAPHVDFRGYVHEQAASKPGIATGPAPTLAVHVRKAMPTTSESAPSTSVTDRGQAKPPAPIQDADHQLLVELPSVLATGQAESRGEPPSFARRVPSRAASRSEDGVAGAAGAAGLETLPGFPSQSGEKPPSSAPRVPSRAASHSEDGAAGATGAAGLETLSGFPSQSHGEPPSFAPRVPSRAASRSEDGVAGAAGAAGLETLPGFPSQSRGEPPSFARRVPSREGLETLPGFPSQSRGEPPSFARRVPSRAASHSEDGAAGAADSATTGTPKTASKPPSFPAMAHTGQSPTITPPTTPMPTEMPSGTEQASTQTIAARADDVFPIVAPNQGPDTSRSKSPLIRSTPTSQATSRASYAIEQFRSTTISTATPTPLSQKPVIAQFTSGRLAPAAEAKPAPRARTSKQERVHTTASDHRDQPQPTAKTTWLPHSRTETAQPSGSSNSNLAPDPSQRVDGGGSERATDTSQPQPSAAAFLAYSNLPSAAPGQASRQGSHPASAKAPASERPAAVPQHADSAQVETPASQLMTDISPADKSGPRHDSRPRAETGASTAHILPEPPTIYPPAKTSATHLGTRDARPQQARAQRAQAGLATVQEHKQPSEAQTSAPEPGPVGTVALHEHAAATVARGPALVTPFSSQNNRRQDLSQPNRGQSELQHVVRSPIAIEGSHPEQPHLEQTPAPASSSQHLRAGSPKPSPVAATAFTPAPSASPPQVSAPKSAQQDRRAHATTASSQPAASPQTPSAAPQRVEPAPTRAKPVSQAALVPPAPLPSTVIPSLRSQVAPFLPSPAMPSSAAPSPRSVAMPSPAALPSHASAASPLQTTPVTEPQRTAAHSFQSHAAPSLPTRAVPTPHSAPQPALQSTGTPSHTSPPTQSAAEPTLRSALADSLHSPPASSPMPPSQAVPVSGKPQTTPATAHPASTKATAHPAQDPDAKTIGPDRSSVEEKHPLPIAKSTQSKGQPKDAPRPATAPETSPEVAQSAPGNPAKQPATSDALDPEGLGTSRSSRLKRAASPASPGSNPKSPAPQDPLTAKPTAPHQGTHDQPHSPAPATTPTTPPVLHQQPRTAEPPAPVTRPITLESTVGQNPPSSASPATPQIALPHPISPLASTVPLPLLTVPGMSPIAATDSAAVGFYQMPTVSADSAQLYHQAADDPGLAVAVLAHAAHVSLASDGGDLSLHVRVRDGNADVNVSGSMAPMFESKAPEVRTVLAAQGLGLSSFATEQQGSQQHSQQRPEPALAEPHHHPAMPTLRASTPANVATGDEGRIHITA